MVSSTNPWTQPPTKLKRRASGSAWCGATGISASGSCAVHAGQALLANPVASHVPKGITGRRKHPGSTAWDGGWTSANNFAERGVEPTDPQEVSRACSIFVSPEVMQAVGRAETRQQALVLLFMSAEFQRR